jgi:hypothetical protein
VRPLLHVMDEVGPKHVLKVVPTVDQEVVEALGSYRPDESLGEGVCLRSSDRRADDPDALYPEEDAGTDRVARAGPWVSPPQPPM